MARSATIPFPILDFIPVGFRFKPTDEELVSYYLNHKLLNDNFPINIIPDIDLCKVEPWQIPALSKIKSDDPEWFFFSGRDYKYGKSKRSNRATKGGYWKATGQDRYIKERGTTNVIGSKKTLVFYSGRVPNGVKTNWVIHEYHATTFDDSQRNFVLCRLMKKAERKSEDGTDAQACDEGEPSTHMEEADESVPSMFESPDVDMGSIFHTLPQDGSSSQHSPVSIEQQESFPFSPSENYYLVNEDRSMHIQFETNEEKQDAEKFADSILDGGSIAMFEERQQHHTFMNNHLRSVPSMRVCYESSDTDAEVVSRRAGSREYHVSKMVQSSHSAACTDKTRSISSEDFWGVDSSSCDSNADKPFEISSIEISSPPSALSRSKNQYNPRLSQTHRKVSSNAIPHLEDKKKLTTVEQSRRDQEKAQKTSPGKKLETRSSDVNRIGSFIHLEPCSSSESLTPRAVYLVNVVIGILLLLAISWDVLSC
ncbi:hypothetical protein HN51_021210 [Arachis hypogaea]|uniref:NAC domain-containing protein n=1 Tax=Arachis hypogaea TaxID=3818 RepID=A0A445EHJ8_ARAHY|nr:NAC domain-containing protein 62 isoform X1 [Arachis hypogaea]QHO52234.1 Protein NTM1-like [Arachis hypogaea]RYR74910.1 hypothetical protein Ahy_A02g009621 [Arachis hypogaea]